MTRDDIRFELERFAKFPTDDRRTVATIVAVLFAEAMARKAAQAERARCIRAIKNTVAKIWQADGARRAIAAIEALEDTP